MEYLDTSYVISLSTINDVNHELAVKISKDLSEPIVSNLTVIELYTYYSRNPDKELMELVGDLKLVVKSSVKFSLEKANARIIEVDLNNIIDYAKDLAVEFKLKTLDLLHIAAAINIGVNTIVSFDKEILKLKGKLEKEYSITIIP